MKNFSKLLALGVAMSLTFGMTVFAAENPSVSTKDPNVSNATLSTEASTINAANEDVTVSAVSVKVYDTAATVADSKNFATEIAEKLDAEEVTKVDLVTVFDLTGKTGEITLKGLENKVSTSAKYVMWHVFDNGSYEILPVTVNSDGSITFTTGSNSVFALYKVEATEKDGEDEEDDDDDSAAPAVTSTGAPASPKTGETLPVAGIAMMIALAGAAVCATKVRYNN
ncbi:MAG: hypothetical protein NC126_04960 [Clostridium sp.]|nr:hypothetical protein [Clostridium sp.]